MFNNNRGILETAGYFKVPARRLESVTQAYRFFFWKCVLNEWQINVEDYALLLTTSRRSPSSFKLVCPAIQVMSIFHAHHTVNLTAEYFNIDSLHFTFPSATLTEGFYPSNFGPKGASERYGSFFQVRLRLLICKLSVISIINKTFPEEIAMPL